jgi:hypothetical protein
MLEEKGPFKNHNDGIMKKLLIPEFLLRTKKDMA